MSYAIAINDADSAGSWVKLLGLGTLDTVDDRGPYRVLNPQAIIALTRKVNPDGAIPIDFDHAIDTHAVRGLPAPAAGFAEDFEVRDDGVYGRISWTALGKAALSRGPNGEPAYRAISPVFEFDPVTRTVSRILRCGLTNRPNLPSMDIAICSTVSQGRSMTISEKIERLRAQLSAHSREEHDDKPTMTASEKQIAQNMGLTDEQYCGARSQRAERAAAEASAAPVKIQPFILDKVPAPKFVGF
jgi:phage I-like protein